MAYAHPVVFYVAAGLAVAVFLLGLAGRVALWRRGKARAWEGRLDRPTMARAVAGRVLLQSQLFRQSPLRWGMHMAIFWGFVLLFLESLWLMVLAWLVPAESGVGRFFEGYAGQALLGLWGDVWGLVLVAGVVTALVRRYVVRPAQVRTMFDDALTLWFLLAVALTGFAAEGVRLAGGSETAAGWSFVGRGFTWVSTAFGIQDAMTLFWVHGLLSLVFLALVPYGKLMHMVAAPIEIPISAATSLERGEAL